MARKEIVVEEVQRLMDNLELVRNIAIVAHVDHGKCISGDTRLCLTDGRVVSAKGLYEEIAKGQKLVKNTNNETVYAAEDIFTHSLNKKTGEIEKKPISFGWKLKGGKTLKIKLRNGSEIDTTPEHKYVVLGNLGIEHKEAKDLQIGDSVVCPKTLRIENDYSIKEKILHAISRDHFHIYLKNECASEVKKEFKDKNIEYKKLKEILGTTLSVDGLKVCFYKNRFRSNDFIKLYKYLGIPLEIAYEGIDKICYRKNYGHRSKSSKPMKLPQDFGEFFFLTGLLFGDGSKDKFVVGKKELGKRFVNILENLGIKPAYRNYKGKTPEISSGSKTLIMLLKALFDYPDKQKSKNIKATEFLFTAPDECVSAFISAYFDCDGTVEKSRRAISITSVSDQMLNDLQILLLRFNCASIKQGNTLYVAGNSVKKFNEKIGFTLLEKITKAKELESKAVGSYVLDVVPVSKEAFLNAKGDSSMSSVASNYYEYAGQKTKPTVSSLSKIASKLDNPYFEMLSREELAFIEVISINEGHEKEVYDFTVEDNHNFVAEGMFIHNTTLSDSLVARAGLISKELAGQQRVLDYDAQEQARGITIKAANISLGFNYEGNDYLINLIDTPGHVDFGGHVTRAMRAVDGVVVVIDAVEGIMPQTETVLRQALKERAKPIIFVNKVDRLINELKMDQKAMVEKLVKIITGVNKIIAGNMPAEIKGKEDWTVAVENGNIAFGSAFHKWAVSKTSMEQYNISFKDIYEKCDAEDHAFLVEKSPVDSVLLEMVIKHLPNPKTAQPYRVPILWKNGDLESEEGKSMMTCSKEGQAIGVCFGIVHDEHAGEVGVVRLFSGEVKKGDQIYISSKKKFERVQQVGIYMGPDRIQSERISAGNIGSIVGLKDLYIGETISSKEIIPFEQIKHYSEPVVTKSIEAKHSKDLAKLIEVLRGISKEDPTIRVELNPETGEHLISGMGELHLEIIEYKISKEKKVEIVTSPPIVVYRETIRGRAGPLEGKSPNKHNKLKVIVEPLDEKIVEAIENGDIPEGKPKGKELVEKLVELGMDRDEAKSLWDICNRSIMVNGTKGIQYLNEAQELIVQGFEDIVRKGPLAAEKMSGVKVTLLDATLHEDNIHRGPAQMLPTIKRPLSAALLMADEILMEPRQKILIQTPQEYAGEVLNMTNGRRGQLLNMEQEGETTTITTVVPVAEMFGFSNALRGATQGRSIWYQEYAGYHQVPKDMVPKIVRKIRERKGLKADIPTPQEFME